MTAPFVSVDEGVRVRLTADEALILRGLPDFLMEIEQDAEDPALARLNPMAYPADPAADREFRRMVEGEAADERRADRSAFELTAEVAAEGTVLSHGEAEAWLRVLDEVRLVLATRLGIDSEISPPAADAELDGEELQAFYDYLTWLQAELVEVLAGYLQTT